MSPVAVRLSPVAAFVFVEIVYLEEPPLFDRNYICVCSGLVQHVRFGVRLALGHGPINASCCVKVMEPQKKVDRFV